LVDVALWHVQLCLSGQGYATFSDFKLYHYPTAGNRYEVSAGVFAAEPDLQKLNGELIAAIHPELSEQFYLHFVGVRLIGFVIAALAVILLAIGFLRRANHKA
jgi:hypothetical protein